MHLNPSDNTYLIDDDLKSVVEMALHMGTPLLVTGEPGTGKTELAAHVARQLGSEQLIFNTKTTSKAKDLLYQYNALTHFRDSQTGKKELNTMQYVSFQALGKAILEVEQKRQVVLIDEIDKAPRDFSNDVLYEFERLAFRVDEAGMDELSAWAKKQKIDVPLDEKGFFHVRHDHPNRPVLILTSNSEKNLPDAFLRRCAYFHIPFPQRDRLLEIITQKGGLSPEFSEAMLEAAIDHFLQIREQNLRKKPATAELLSWVHILDQQGIDLKSGANGSQAELKRKLRQSYAFLLKNREDRELLMES